jgi:hypothetical protein
MMKQLMRIEYQQHIPGGNDMCGVRGVAFHCSITTKDALAGANSLHELNICLILV